MVFSKIDKTFEYPETKMVDKKDFEEDADIHYNFTIFNTEFEIILGKTHRSRSGFFYIYMYVVENDKIKERIGLIEFYDAEDTSNMDKPLLFREFREKVAPWIVEFMDDDAFGITETRDNGDCFFDTLRIAFEEVGVDTSIRDLREFVAESEDTKIYYNEKKKQFNGFVIRIVDLFNKKKKFSHIFTTMNYFFRMDDFPIFFGLFLSGLKETLRKNNVSTDNCRSNDPRLTVRFDAFKSLILSNFKSVVSSEDGLLIFDGVKKRLNVLGDTENALAEITLLEEKEKKKAALIAKEKAKETNDKKAEEISNKEVIRATESIQELEDFSGGIETLAEEISEIPGNLELYKKFILTNDFWADDLSIKVLEEELNIKIIIVSEEQYISKKETLKKNEPPVTFENFDAVICQGGIVEEPIYYIMASKSQNHYRLITYNGKSIFITFDELPEKIKNMVLRCTSGEGNSFNQTKQVLEYKKKRRGGTKKRHQKNKR